MKFFKWKSKGFIECDMFAELSREEFKLLGVNLESKGLKRISLDDEHYYAFINTKYKIIAPLKTLSYAFGGMYWEIPVGDEMENIKVDISEYSIEDEEFLIKLAQTSNRVKNSDDNNKSLDLKKLKIFAKKWRNIFFNSSWNGKIIESVMFPYEAWEAGLVMDSCESFSAAYPDVKLEGDNKHFFETIKSVDNVWVLGNLIFSQWRWWNHWAGARPNEDDFRWFLIAFDRLIELLERNKQYEDKLGIIGFHLPDEEYGCFSNWYPSEFSYARNAYSSVEQYMMYQKVMMAMNFELSDKIMSTNDPAKTKEYGSAKYFHDFNSIRDAWDRYSYVIVKRGVRAKFLQNPELMAKLLLTGDALLAECSRTDKIWGIGININDTAWKDVSNWNGTNKMGRILMELRAEFLAMELAGIELEFRNATDSDAIFEWSLKPAELSLYPEYHKAVAAYVATLSEHERIAFMGNDYSFADWDEAMRTNMGGGLRIIGFYEMKQEIYDIAAMN